MCFYQSRLLLILCLNKYKNCFVNMCFSILFVNQYITLTSKHFLYDFVYQRWWWLLIPCLNSNHSWKPLRQSFVLAWWLTRQVNLKLNNTGLKFMVMFIKTLCLAVRVWMEHLVMGALIIVVLYLARDVDMEGWRHKE
jgi:hypothetical protein